MAVDRRGLTSTARRTWAFITVGIVAALAVPLVLPGMFDLAGWPGYLHLLSFRLVLGLGTAAAAGVLALTLLRWTSGPAVLRIGLIAVFAVVATANIGTVLVRGWSGPAPAGDADLTVLAFNTQGDATDPADVATLLIDRNIMVASLPETMPPAAKAITAAAADRGVDYQVFLGSDSPGAGRTTALLIRSDLGRYRQLPAPYLVLGAARAEPASGSGPTFAAVHPVAPVTKLGLSAWADYTNDAADQCRDFDNTIVAGDFNATVDHPPLQDLAHCADAASATGRGAEGTWPSDVPAVLASPIDHVLYDERSWRAVASWTETIGGSDHRAVIAHLDRTEQP